MSFAIATVFLGSVAMAFCARWFWPGELICSFQPMLAALAFPLAGLLLFLRRRILAGACLLAAVVLLLPMTRYLPFRGLERHAALEFRLATLNLQMRKPDTLRLEPWLESNDPDVLAGQEVCAETELRLHELLSVRGYRSALPPPGTERLPASSGQVLFTRLPLTGFRVISEGWKHAGLLVADLERGDRRVRLIATHGTKPKSKQRFHGRNQAFRTIARLARESPTAVVCGDLNVTGFSPFFADLLRDGQLTDSRDGIAWQPTFTPSNPFQFPRPILALDHVLLGRELVILERLVGPDIGSDHLPVLARIGFRD